MPPMTSLPPGPGPLLPGASQSVASVEVVLKGGHADGRIATVPLPLPDTVMTLLPPPPLRLGDEDPDVTFVPEVAAPYDFTGTARVNSDGSIRQAIYRARGT